MLQQYTIMHLFIMLSIILFLCAILILKSRINASINKVNKNLELHNQIVIYDEHVKLSNLNNLQSSWERMNKQKEEHFSKAFDNK